GRVGTGVNGVQFMNHHLRASLWLILVTLVLCAVVYPLVLLGVGLVFSDQAEGSLLRDEQKKIVGSRLIAQEFKSANYFHPPPPATSDKPYNASFSGGSNWGASNYALRDRVARQLGPMVKYSAPETKAGQFVGRGIEKWLRADTFGPSKEKGIVA